jgi:hypothetical protein
MPDLDSIGNAHPCGRSSWLPLVLFVHGVVYPSGRRPSDMFRAARATFLVTPIVGDGRIPQEGCQGDVPGRALVPCDLFDFLRSRRQSFPHTGGIAIRMPTRRSWLLSSLSRPSIHYIVGNAYPSC